LQATWVPVRVKKTRQNQNGRTIPTRGISVLIQPNTMVFRSSPDIGRGEIVMPMLGQMQAIADENQRRVDGRR